MARGGLKAIKVRGTNTSRVGHGEGEEEEQPLSPGSRLFHEPDFSIYVVVIFSFKTPINLTVFKQLMSPLLHHPRFSSTLHEDGGGTGELKWVPTRVVDIDDHIIVPALDTTVGTSPDKVVDDYISNLSKSRMDMSRPMWEWHVLNLKTSDAESTAILRLHHCLGDGVSLMSLFLSLGQGDSNSNTLPTTRNKIEQHPTDHNTTGWAGGWLTRAQSMFSTLLNTLLHTMIMILARLFLTLTDTETPLRRRSYAPGWNPRRFVRKTISLDDVKMVKNAMDATINDVMLGVTQAALSQYLNRKYGEAEKDATKRNNNTYLPKNIRLRALMPINLRASRGVPDLAEMMKVNSKEKWGNMIGFLVVPFNIDGKKKEDPLDHVRESKATMDKEKAAFQHHLYYFMVKTLLSFYPSMVAKFVRKLTFAFSNIQGPAKEVTLFGHQVTNIAPTIYGTYPLAMVIHVGSYANKMNIILSVDEGVISDPHQLCNDIGESFDLIKQSVMAQDPMKLRTSNR